MVWSPTSGSDGGRACDDASIGHGVPRRWKCCFGRGVDFVASIYRSRWNTGRGRFDERRAGQRRVVECGPGSERRRDAGGTYYTAVFQLQDGVRTEYWLVGTTSPATLSAVRATPGVGVAAPLASKVYVDNAIAANKGYVDSAVASVGSGSYVSKAGDAMSGPLTLPSDPSGSNQAATKHYVDTGLAAKANVIAGVVPPTQLDSGAPDGTLCLKGDSSWGACGTSSNAATIQNVAVDTTAPNDGQVLTYQASTQKYTPKSGSTIGGSPSAGMQVVGNGSSFAAQAKPAIDVRDFGVECTGSAASDSACGRRRGACSDPTKLRAEALDEQDLCTRP